MVKAVLTARPGSSYDDLIEYRYHFPRQYLPAMQRALHDFIVYYEPRRGDGRESYIAVARIADIEPDPDTSDHYYARIEDYLDFDRPVPWRHSAGAYEARLLKDDGSPNAGLFGWSVRSIEDHEFGAIVAVGFGQDPWESVTHEQTPAIVPFGVAEELVAFERPLIEQTVLRPFRDRAFRRSVRLAYENKCALTGISLINGGGRPEVEAAHIMPVQHNGPDSTRNGIALSGTMHWLFDRGLISVSEDHRILTVESAIPEPIANLLNKDRHIILPADSAQWPHPRFLAHHREKVFKGAAA